MFRTPPKPFLLLVALLAGGLPTRSAILDFAPFGDHMYLLLSPGTWHEKQAEAEQLGGHLISINSSAENEFIRQRWIAERIVCVWPPTGNCPPVWPPLPWANPRVFEAWIGFTDTSLEGTFVWVDGQPVTFTNWIFGMPFDPSGNEDFTLISSGGKWVDVEGTSSWSAVAEVEPVPEPSTFALLSAMASLTVFIALWQTRHAPRG